MKIDGKQIAQRIFEELREKVKKLKTQNIIPNLAIILVGNDPASIAYVNQKKIKGELIGAKISIFNLESKIQNAELKDLIDKLNEDNSVHGIIVQQPLPIHIDVKKITQTIDPKKDVDGFHPQSKFEMPIALAVLKILETIYATPSRWPNGLLEGEFQNWLSSKKTVVMGKGETGGKPVIHMLKKKGFEPIIIDSKTKNPESLTKTADIIISAVGKSDVIKPNMIKKGVILISIGLHREGDKLSGDYDEEKIKNIASFYTPTPGGVGPVNVAMLLKNLVLAAECY